MLTKKNVYMSSTSVVIVKFSLYVHSVCQLCIPSVRKLVKKKKNNNNNKEINKYVSK